MTLQKLPTNHFACSRPLQVRSVSCDCVLLNQDLTQHSHSQWIQKITYVGNELEAAHKAAVWKQKTNLTTLENFYQT